MKITPASAIEPRVFDTAPAKGVTGRVLVGKGDGATNFCMRLFELAPDGHSPRHSHPWEHEIFFHAGQGEVFGDGRWTPVSAGYTAFVPGDSEHQIRNTGDTPLVFVCVIPSGPPEL